MTNNKGEPRLSFIRIKHLLLLRFDKEEEFFCFFAHKFLLFAKRRGTACCGRDSFSAIVAISFRLSCDRAVTTFCFLFSCRGRPACLPLIVLFSTPVALSF